MRTSRALRVVTGPRSTLEQAQHAERTAAEELASAKRAEDLAVQAYDSSGASVDEDLAARARLRRERAERIVAQRQAAVREAQEVVDAAEREAARQRLAVLTKKLDALPAMLQPSIEKLSAMREEAAAIREAVAGQVADLEEMHAEAASIASRLGVELRALAPTIGLAKLLVGIGLHLEDVRSARDAAVTDWLTPKPEPRLGEPQFDQHRRAMALLTKPTNPEK